jgi:hypothetical protein
MERLLIIGCSEKKLTTAEPVSAIERYDGPSFRVLRKYLREVDSHLLTVMILSAKYGLITADRDIPYYDQRLTRSSARGLRPAVLDAAGKALQARDWSTVGICAGKVYQIALEGLSDLAPVEVPIYWLKGGQGTRLTNLKKWLHDLNLHDREHPTQRSAVWL